MRKRRVTQDEIRFDGRYITTLPADAMRLEPNKYGSMRWHTDPESVDTATPLAQRG